MERLYVTLTLFSCACRFFGGCNGCGRTTPGVTHSALAFDLLFALGRPPGRAEETDSSKS